MSIINAKVFKDHWALMRSNYRLLLLFCMIAVNTHAQNEHPPSLNIGDPAPPLRVKEWLKGIPVQSFEKGHVYVVEFWATWCKPCIAAMPYLSALAREYKDSVTIIGIDVYEHKTTSLEKVKTFVDSMGYRMDYHVAAEDSNFTVADWIEATRERDNGIPRTFVVNSEGRLAWIGHPKDLDEVLPKIVNNTWDIKEELAKRNLNRYLAELDDSLNHEMRKYVGDPFKPGDLGKPDSALLMISEIVRNEPKLIYAPFIASHTFSSLLITDTHKAYEFGKEVLLTPTYEEPACYVIIGRIEWYSDKLNLPAEIYQLGAEAYQMEIDRIPYPELVNIPKKYYKMAKLYWHAKNKAKAIDAMQKAIEVLKSKKDFSVKDMAAFESRLQQYKNM